MNDELFEDEDDGGEIEVNIDPRDETLDKLGINREEFEESLLDALDAYNDEIDGGDLSRPLEDVVLTIKGTTHRLGDLADITVEETDGMDDDEDEDEDDEPEAEPQA